MIRVLLIVLSTALLSLGQSSPAGKWGYEMDTPNGKVPVTLDLQVEGEKVTGTVGTDPSRTFKIENGTFKDGVVQISFKRDRPDGGAMAYQMSAKLEGDVLKGSTTADMGGEKVTQEWEAKRK